MSSKGEDDRIEKLKRDVKRIKRMRMIKMLLSLILAVGVISDLAVTYSAAKEIKVTDKKLISIAPEGNLLYRATLQFTFSNPSEHTIEINGITYTIYVEGTYLADGDKGEFTIPSGTSNRTFDVEFDLRDVGGALDEMLGKDVLHLRIKGTIKVPAKFFGLFTWKVLPIPYDITGEFHPQSQSGGIPPVVLEIPIETTYNSVTLRWSRYPNDDFLKYEVHFSTEKNFKISDATLASTIQEQNSTEYTVGNLETRTTYYFKIRVYNQLGMHADSNEVSATTHVIPIP